MNPTQACSPTPHPSGIAKELKTPDLLLYFPCHAILSRSYCSTHDMVDYVDLYVEHQRLESLGFELKGFEWFAHGSSGVGLDTSVWGREDF